MKARTGVILVVLAVLTGWTSASLGQAPVGTAFTYQGQLKQGGLPVTNTADFQFSLWDAATTPPGVQVGTTQSVNGATVTNGLFTVTLDFGASAFTGDARYLEIAVRSPSGSGDSTTLDPRQELTAAPYATRAALNWALSGNAGTNPATAFVGTTDNQPLTLRVNNQEVDRLEFGDSKACGTMNWRRGFVGNWRVPAAACGTVIAGGGVNGAPNGVSDDFGTVSGGSGNQAGDGGGSETDTTHATVGGGENNLAGAAYATISGGKNNVLVPVSTYGVVGGGVQNRVEAGLGTIGGGTLNTINSFGFFGTIGGGAENTAGWSYVTIAGGSENEASEISATVGGGWRNEAWGSYSTVGGGADNASGPLATVGGGESNSASGSWSTVPGGSENSASGSYSFAAGRLAEANHTGSFVWADSTGVPFASTAKDQFLIRASGGALVQSDVPNIRNLEIRGFNTELYVRNQNDYGGTYANASYQGMRLGLRNEHPTLSWGILAPQGSPGDTRDFFGFRSDGLVGSLTSDTGGAMAFRNVLDDGNGYAGIGTTTPSARLHVAGVAGVDGIMFPDDTLQTTAALASWELTGNAGTTPGIHFLGTTDNQALELKVNNARALRIVPNVNTDYGPVLIGGHPLNAVTAGADAAVICGGGHTNVPNRITDMFGVVCGGTDNIAGNDDGNPQNCNYGTIVGGASNRARGMYSFVGGGTGNEANGLDAVVAGGYMNKATDTTATVPGGHSNEATGMFSFAAGRRAKAAHQGTFVWADSTDADFTSTANDQFLVRAAGGVGINTTNLSGYKLTVESPSANQPGILSRTTATTGWAAAIVGESSNNGWGVSGASQNVGVIGWVDSTGGYWGDSAISGSNSDGRGVAGLSVSGVGVLGTSETGDGVYGTSNGATMSGVVGINSQPAGWGVYAVGRLGASGTKSFQIDHPLDPANKYLQHYTTEGPEPLNTYGGTAILDNAGEAWILLPDYFETINRDFRYQLTPIGAAMPHLHVAAEIEYNQFLIAGGEPGMKVSWEVKGVRNDPYVRAYGAPVEVEKTGEQRGTYLHPELYGQPAEFNLRAPMQPATADLSGSPVEQEGTR